MQITGNYLVAATGCTRARAELYASSLDSAAERWGIDSPLRCAAWLAQVAHESSLFSRTKESLYYTTPARLVAVWPSRFRMPIGAKEAKMDRLPGGKRNPNFYVRDEAKLAEFAYGGRMGNGPEGSGDGSNFIGRGLIMLTGRENYDRYQSASGYPVVRLPGMLSEPLAASDSAAWFWASRGLNNYADRFEFETVSRKVNGGTVGMVDRLRLTKTAMAAAGVAVA